jgi:hypothetical protein
VAYIYKGADNPRASDPGYSLSYEELAQVYQAANSGNAAAAIKLAQLPAGERRLAEMVTKAFGGKVSKPKKVKSKKPKSLSAVKEYESWLKAQTASSDPAVRERALRELGL